MYAFSCSNDEATVAASGAARVTLGSATVYAGTQQVSGNNQDPRVARFDNGTLSWCRDDLERSNDDGRAYGVLWSGDRLYVAFTATGSQGEESGDLRRFTTGGWLSSYSDASPGGGGGGKVSAIIALDPATGDGRTGSWLTALNNGKTNSLVVTSLALDGGGLRVGALSWFAPRGLDRTALLCTGGSPFAASYQFSADLSAVSAATAERCSTV